MTIVVKKVLRMDTYLLQTYKPEGIIVKMLFILLKVYQSLRKMHNDK